MMCEKTPSLTHGDETLMLCVLLVICQMLRKMLPFSMRCIVLYQKLDIIQTSNPSARHPNIDTPEYCAREAAGIATLEGGSRPASSVGSPPGSSKLRAEVPR